MTVEKMATNKTCRECGGEMERHVTIGQFGKMVERLHCVVCHHNSAWAAHDISREPKEESHAGAQG